MNLSILHVTTITEWRGGDAQMYALYRLLEEVPGVRQWILCPSGSVLEGKCRDDGARCVGYRKSRFKLVNAVRALVATARREGIGILHAHDSSALNVCLLALRFLPGNTRLVVSRKRNNPIGSSLFSRRKYGSPRIDRLVCVSDSVQRVFDGVVDPHRLLTIYDSVDVAALSARPRSRALQEAFGVPAGARVVGNLAGYTEQKDLATFLGAAKAMIERADPAMDLRFFVVGEGPQRAALQALAGSLGIADRVVLTGYRTDAVDLLSAFDVLMMSSRTEGLPLSIYEAFALRVPVVSTDAGGIAEVVRDGHSGFVVPVGDAGMLAERTLQVLQDPALARRFGESGHAIVAAGHTPGVFREQYLRLYHSLDPAR